MDYGASMERRTAFLALLPTPQRHSQVVSERGFTLLEMLVALTLVVIVMSIAIPSFTNTIKNQRLVTSANELLVSLSLARSTAITTRAPAVVCRSSNATQAAPVCGAGSGWHEGWFVFSDNNANGVFDALEEQLWEQHGPLPTDVTVNVGANADVAVRFRALGTVPGFNTTFQVCDDRKSDSQFQSNMRQVVLAFSGRAQVREGIGGTACR